MTRIYLLRHGETAWNADGNRYCGRTDLPLSATGQMQASLAARALANVPLDVVYVSPLCRSRETGAAIARSRGLSVLEDPRLIEVDFGAWEGLTSAEIEAADPVGRASWIRDPSRTRAGGTGETGRAVSDRMEHLLQDVARDRPSATIAVVGHSTANRLALAATLGAPLASYRRVVLDNCSISLLEIEGGATRWLRINDVAHLAP